MKVSTRSRSVTYSAFAFLFSLLLALAPVASAQQCLPDPSSQSIGSLQPGEDGKIHVKYRFKDENGNAITPDASMTAAMDQAAGRWNTRTGTTNVVFEAAGPNDYADLIVIPTSDQNKNLGCAAVDPLFGYIYYDPALVTAAQANVADAGTVLAHELGHFLGLGDAGVNPNPPTIMNNPGPGMSCTNFSVPSTTPTLGDATKAAECAQAARNAQTLINPPSGGGGGGGGYLYDYPSYDCYDRYLVTDYYTCTSSGCEYMGSDWQYLGVVCYNSY